MMEKPLVSPQKVYPQRKHMMAGVISKIHLLPAVGQLN